jgi:ankyrin repeat protein
MKYIKTFEIKKPSTIDEELINAAKNGSNESIKKIIKKPGVNIDCVLPGTGKAYDRNYNRVEAPSNKKTPLIFAVENKFIMVVDTLIKAGANVNLGDFEGRTALMYASTMKIVDMLLKTDIDINKTNDDNRTVIMDYLYTGRWSPDQMIMILEKFLAKGLDLDIEDLQGQNFYYLLKDILLHLTPIPDRIKLAQEVINYIDEKFPKYKTEFEITHGKNGENCDICIEKSMDKYNF